VESSVNIEKSLRVAVVAGEESGDILGGGLLQVLKQRYPHVHFEGVGGSRMMAAGLRSEFPMERLSVMGLVEVLKRLPELLNRRKRLIKHWSSNPPDLFIGIDAPDFNLGLARALKQQGIATVHYVSPSVWAWRESRIKKIEQSVDLMLCFLPFEAAYYEQTAVEAKFVGHPLASQLPLPLSKEEAKKQFGLELNKPVVALMPGSRGSEVARLGGEFIKTAQWLSHRRGDLQFVMPAANNARFEQLNDMVKAHNSETLIRIVQGQSQELLMASDTVLISSGTATLEAMLCQRPMVVCYKMARLSFAIISRMLNTPFISLPNLLANKSLVPELFQGDVIPDTLGPLILKTLDDKAYRSHLNEQFDQFSQVLRTDADQCAAEAVSELIERL